MIKDSSAPVRRRVPPSCLTLVLATAGLWLVTRATRAAETPTVSGDELQRLAADAQKLFDTSDNAVLRGTFAAGDHVRLTIDFKERRLFVGIDWRWGQSRK